MTRPLVDTLRGPVAIDRYARRSRHRAHLPLDEDTRHRIEDAAPLSGPLGLGPHLDVDTTPLVLRTRLDEIVARLRSRDSTEVVPV